MNRIMNELKSNQIELSDLSGEGTKIDILFEADIFQQLMTTKSINLDSGLIGVETTLGWCVMGKPNETFNEINSLITLVIDVSNVSLSDFWEFEILGIYHPVKVETAETTYVEHLTALKEKLNIFPDGRYKLELPFKDFFQNLLDNKELSWKRHEKMMQKLKWNNFLGDYQKV
ncbi:hypothetical protein AVEN_79869-1 [Araneus ventricosus]|uniref:Peptidase aspartic putative domain-containing protein n=1 Tax=Araneus ventricosus TaxID=182803 RepID=A0A4Y2DS90_ARAVE|nr:hypothetical protein AVEN_79869-1 [Araneus ventricosus]